MKKNSGKYYYIPITVTFVMLFVMFAVVLSSMSYKPVSVNTVEKDSAYDWPSDSQYDFVETEGRNGIKYYVITQNSTQTTTALLPSQSVTGTTNESAFFIEEPTYNHSSTTATAVPTDASAVATTTASSVAQTTATTAKPQRNSDEKVAYLTFDDGPSVNTEKILDILDRYDVKATFFVIYHKKMESKYQAIVERGHTIALHSYTHSYRKIYASEKAYFEDLEKIHDYVEKVTGVDSRIIRFPGGSSNTISNKYHKGIMKDLKEDVTEKGFIYHDWNVDSTDASGINRDPELLIEKVKTGIKKKKVINILMHDTGKSKVTTVEALPDIIEYVLSQGYQIEPLTEESDVIQHTR